MLRADRYLWEEVVTPFLVGVQVILVPLLGDSLYYLMRMVIVHHVDLLTVGRLLLFLVPAMMCNAFPLATILAVSLAVSRLAREGEWSALRLGGWGLGRMARPFVAFGLAVGVMHWVVSEHLAPAANKEFGRLVTQISLRTPTATLKPQTWVSPAGAGWALYVSRIDESTGTLSGLVIFCDLQSDFPTVLSARQARFGDGEFALQGVVRHVWRADGTLEREGESESAVFRVGQLAETAGIEMRTVPDPRSASQLREEVGKQRGSHGTLIDLHRRYAAPMACLVLALLCIPLNLMGGRRAGYLGLLVSAVLVVVYFLTLQLGVSLARNGFLRDAPLVGVWLQNIIFGGLALLLLWRQRR
ncbi:MAG: LptF/LptG family permease [Armatimonadetes bacterium]|nr:LptF/LptG family permease [Armatimonadota bacterium]